MFRYFCMVWLSASVGFAQEINTLWLVHSRTVDTVTICWVTDTEGDSTVFFGNSPMCDKSRDIADKVTLHQVEIPMPPADGKCFYRVETRTEHGTLTSQTYAFQGYPSDHLRVVVLGNLHCLKLPETITKQNAHLLMTAGDNVPCLHKKGMTKEQAKENIEPFLRLIRNNRECFATTIFMPVLGNHDREIAPRGKRVWGPSQFYDVDATAYCRLFPLPEKRWVWYYDVPRFSLKIVALDLNHTSDLGTSLQTSHSYKIDDEQYRWYEQVMNNATQKYIVTVQNERCASVRSLENGAWGKLFAKGTICVAGFGHYAERAQTDNGMVYYNTSTYGRGDKYPDPKKCYFESVDNFLLLTFHDGKMTSQLLRLEDGHVLDSQTFSK